MLSCATPPPRLSALEMHLTPALSPARRGGIFVSRLANPCSSAFIRGRNFVVAAMTVSGRFASMSNTAPSTSDTATRSSGFGSAHTTSSTISLVEGIGKPRGDKSAFGFTSLRIGFRIPRCGTLEERPRKRPSASRGRLRKRRFQFFILPAQESSQIIGVHHFDIEIAFPLRLFNAFPAAVPNPRPGTPKQAGEKCHNSRTNPSTIFTGSWYKKQTTPRHRLRRKNHSGNTSLRTIVCVIVRRLFFVQAKPNLQNLDRLRGRYRC